MARGGAGGRSGGCEQEGPRNNIGRCRCRDAREHWLHSETIEFKRRAQWGLRGAGEYLRFRIAHYCEANIPQHTKKHQHSRPSTPTVANGVTLRAESAPSRPGVGRRAGQLPFRSAKGLQVAQVATCSGRRLAALKQCEHNFVHVRHRRLYSQRRSGREGATLLS